MAINVRSIGDVTILDLPSVYTVERGVGAFTDTLRAQLDQGREKFLLNMNVVYMDEAGIAEIIRAYLVVKSRGGTIKVVNLTRTIGPFPIKFLVVFETFDDEAAAVASFEASRA